MEETHNILDILESSAYPYNNIYELTSVTGSQSHTYDYDLNGNLAKIMDANGNPTTYTYDLFDRLDITQYANLSSSNFDYDKNSNLTKHTTPSGKPIDYAYDALNRLTAKTYPLTPGLNTTYAYDLGGRLIDADNTAADIHFTHDALNRVNDVTQTINSLPFTINYAYDKSGNRTQLVYPGGKTLDYVYDSNDRLTDITHNTANFLQYQYDPLDRRINKSYLSASLPLASYSYDLANQLASVTNTLVNGTPVSQYAYPAYDNVGNRKQLDRTLQTQPTQSIQYNYNNIYELTGTTGAQTHSYDYDNVANREIADSIAYAHNNLNQYTNVAGATYLYDGNGNLISDGANTYTYDEQNRLLSMVNDLSSASYAYDAFNRRVSKTVNGVTTHFVYDGDEIIADYDSAGTLAAQYINGDTIDEILAMERGGNTYYYNYDGLGSVTELTDATGAIAENYTYDPYGNPSVINSTIGNRYRFTGREFDEESEIYHYRARAYNPKIGRFLQRDPLAYMAGMNLFSYAHNNPLSYLDPWGTDTYYVNNQFNSSNPTNEDLYSHSFVAITDVNQYGREVVVKTFSWVNINKGSWEDVHSAQNILGAQKAIDTGVGATKAGYSGLDPYIEEVFESYKKQTGGYSLTENSCHTQALSLIEEAQFQLKITTIMNGNWEGK